MTAADIVALGCPFMVNLPGGCLRCGGQVKGRRIWCSGICSEWFSTHHVWKSAREAARYRDGRRCVQCGASNALEVNHIDPRRGGGYGTGCWNHQTNLETLCIPHHLEETNRQRRAEAADALYRAHAKPRTRVLV